MRGAGVTAGEIEYPGHQMQKDIGHPLQARFPADTFENAGLAKRTSAISLCRQICTNGLVSSGPERSERTCAGLVDLWRWRPYVDYNVTFGAKDAGSNTRSSLGD